MEQYVVLVTGGNGFLGQHVVKHLHLYGTSVKEIRVMDVVQYKQKLDYQPTKPLKTYVGSITDILAVRQACNGADIVLHIASIIDWALFPNRKLLDEVNVKGTETILKACQEECVPYIIYCSSTSLYNGPEEIRAGTESTVRKPSKYYFEAYASSKAKAQGIILSANGNKLKNGKTMRTASILPLPMFGELDYMAIPLSVRPFKGRTYPLVGQMKANLQYSYAGNTAMMFVKAAEAIPKSSAVGGQFFFAADDCPPAPLPEIMKPFLDMFGSKASKWHIPYWFTMILMFLLFCVFFIVRIFKKVPNLHFTFGTIAFLNTTFNVTYDKAKTLLGYSPLYNYKTCIERSKKFYIDII